VGRWCNKHHAERGEVLSVGQVWRLSQPWYHNRLSPDYRGRTVAEVEAIFRQVGLHSPFWRASR
jgi:hypothetical protein